jgi:hypothetical protein
MSYTKGPWKVVSSFNNDHHDDKFCSIQDEKDEFFLAEVCGDIGSIANARGNAYLMAAAPDLLHVCKDIYDFLYRSGYDTTLVKEAIRKAEGK